MDRRVAGGLLLTLAIGAVAVIPTTIQGRRISGSPIPVSLPPPPEVGDCALAPFPRDSNDGGTPAEVALSTVRFGSCAGEIAGEIVDLDDGDDVLTLPAGSSRGRCFLPIATYAGLTPSGQSAAMADAPTDDPVEWLPTIGAIGFLVVPDGPARRAGQDWAACLAAPIFADVYQGGLRDAYGDGSLPVQFGLCWSAVDLDESVTLLPCDQPHAAELLATGWIADRSIVSLSDIEASCRAFAGRSMGTGDPTRGGVISIVMDPVHRDGATSPGAPLAVNCFAAVADGGELSGTVIGLRDAPVPLAG